MAVLVHYTWERRKRKSGRKKVFGAVGRETFHSSSRHKTHRYKQTTMQRKKKKKGQQLFKKNHIPFLCSTLDASLTSSFFAKESVTISRTERRKMFCSRPAIVAENSPIERNECLLLLLLLLRTTIRTTTTILYSLYIRTRLLTSVWRKTGNFLFPSVLRQWRFKKKWKKKIVPDGRLHHHHRRPLESVKLLVPYSNPAAVNPTIETTFVWFLLSDSLYNAGPVVQLKSGLEISKRAGRQTLLVAALAGYFTVSFPPKTQKMMNR